VSFERGDGWLSRRVAQAIAAVAGREDEDDRADAAAADQTGKPEARRRVESSVESENLAVL
jgi:hypothetical protein